MKYPYEESAKRGEPAPKGLSLPQYWHYMSLRVLYKSWYGGVISKEEAIKEKKLLDHPLDVAMNAFKWNDIMSRMHCDLFKNIEGYSNNYAKARESGDIRKALEAADKMYQLLYAMVPMAKEITDEQLRMEVER